MKISSYLALLLTNALIACGGGGGGSGGSTSGANTSSNIIQATTFLGTKTSAGSFTYYRDGSISNPVSYIYAKDINNDGVDEVFFVAFETQPNTQANYSNTSIHISYSTGKINLASIAVSPVRLLYQQSSRFMNLTSKIIRLTQEQI